MSHTDLQSQWRSLLSQAGGRILLAGQNANTIRQVASRLASDNPNNENQLVQMALSMTGNPANMKLTDIFAHQLCCVVREAQWQLGMIKQEHIDSSAHVEGLHWLAETRQAPVILIMPMNIYPSDAIALAAHFIPDRRVVFFGENVTAQDFVHIDGNVEFADNGLSGVRTLTRVLADAGVFCTFADFVYDSRKPIFDSLFGAPRPLSAAFVQFASRPGTMLLPTLVSIENSTLHVCFEEPTLMPTMDRKQLCKSENQAQVARHINTLLEGLIRLAPHQWLLLNTLLAESDQMAEGRP